MRRSRPAATSAATARAEIGRRAIAEPGQTDVADRATGQRLRLDLRLHHDVPDDVDLDRGGAIPDDRQADARALRAADLLQRLVRRLAVDRRSVDGADAVTGPDPRPLRGRAGDRLDDDERAPAAEHGAIAAAADPTHLDPGADPLEPSGEPLKRLAVLVRGEVHRERVAQGGDHALDRPVDELLAVDRLAGVVPGHRPVGVPERLERRLLVGRRPGCRAPQGPQREAGEEQGPTGQDGHEHEGQPADRGAAPWPSGRWPDRPVGRLRPSVVGRLGGGFRPLGGGDVVDHRFGPCCTDDGGAWTPSVRRPTGFGRRSGLRPTTSGGSSGPRATTRGPRARPRCPARGARGPGPASRAGAGARRRSRS